MKRLSILIAGILCIVFLKAQTLDHIFEQKSPIFGISPIDIPPEGFINRDSQEVYFEASGRSLEISLLQNLFQVNKLTESGYLRKETVTWKEGSAKKTPIYKTSEKRSKILLFGFAGVTLLFLIGMIPYIKKLKWPGVTISIITLIFASIWWLPENVRVFRAFFKTIEQTSSWMEISMIFVLSLMLIFRCTSFLDGMISVLRKRISVKNK